MIPTAFQWAISKVRPLSRRLTSQDANAHIALLISPEMARHRGHQSRLGHIAHHLHVLRLDVRRQQLHHPLHRARRRHFAGVAPALPPGLVQEVQLHPWGRTRRRRAGHDLHPVVRGVWRVGRAEAIPCVGRQPGAGQRRLLQRKWRVGLGLPSATGLWVMMFPDVALLYGFFSPVPFPLSVALMCKSSYDGGTFTIQWSGMPLTHSNESTFSLSILYVVRAPIINFSIV